mmetsp:Transcript_17267/g.42871  ORF Transcript_17267/g.42871 Transcript_17267/m.42871 type:complete len:218 (+) Transcript_17267:6772-7425(+)
MILVVGRAAGGRRSEDLLEAKLAVAGRPHRERVVPNNLLWCLRDAGLFKKLCAIFGGRGNAACTSLDRKWRARLLVRMRSCVASSSPSINILHDVRILFFRQCRTDLILLVIHLGCERGVYLHARQARPRIRQESFLTVPIPGATGRALRLAAIGRVDRNAVVSKAGVDFVAGVIGSIATDRRNGCRIHLESTMSTGIFFTLPALPCVASLVFVHLM